MVGLVRGQPMYHTTISKNPIQTKFYADEIYNEVGPGGQFEIDVSKRFSFNRYTTRVGEWSVPFPQLEIPGYEMPSYDPNFNKSYSDITDQRGLEIKKIMEEDPSVKIGLYYSGGMDSMLCLISLLKALNEEQKSRLSICTSMDAVIEYPTFFEQHIYNKINVIDLKMGKIRYHDLADRGYRIITADSGDAMYGTEVATQFYYSYKNYSNGLSAENIEKLGKLISDPKMSESHYSIFADILINYFGLKESPNFGKLYYEKLVKLSNTSPYPIHSLHDFMWQIIFNIKWMHCALRGPLFFGDKENHERSLQHDVINWYQTDDYQRWSMVNNNTGEKIRGITSATYKWAARRYIYEFTKDPWYMNYKIKLASLPKIGTVSTLKHSIDVGMRFGIDTNYDIIRFNDPGVRDYIVHHLTAHQIDW